jgi:hypothetical protein
MRKLPAFAFGFVIFGTLALPTIPTLAKPVPISGTHGAGEIEQKCEGVGVFSGGLKGGGYACNNLDKGTSVICNNNGKCTGNVPRTMKGGSIDTIMRGGTHPVSLKSTSTGNPVGKGTKPIEYKPSSSRSKH